jgi:hypothetical protein
MPSTAKPLNAASRDRSAPPASARRRHTSPYAQPRLARRAPSCEISAIALKAPAKDVNLGPAAIGVRLPRRRNGDGARDGRTRSTRTSTPSATDSSRGPPVGAISTSPIGRPSSTSSTTRTRWRALREVKERYDPDGVSRAGRTDRRLTGPSPRSWLLDDESAGAERKAAASATKQSRAPEPVGLSVSAHCDSAGALCKPALGRRKDSTPRDCWSSTKAALHPTNRAAG